MSIVRTSSITLALAVAASAGFAADTSLQARLGVSMLPGLTKVEGSDGSETLKSGSGFAIEPQAAIGMPVNGPFGVVGVVGVRLAQQDAKFEADTSNKITNTNIGLTLSPRATYLVKEGIVLELGPTFGVGRTSSKFEDPTTSETQTGTYFSMGVVAGGRYAINSKVDVGLEVGFESTQAKPKFDGDPKVKSNGFVAGLSVGYTY